MSNASTDTSFLTSLGIQEMNQGAYAGEWLECTGEILESRSPGTGEVIGRVQMATGAEYERVVTAAEEAFKRWRTVPGPRRGEIVRRMGNAMREHKDALGRLITLEMGKIVQEGWGEVQECIDIADFAVGLSRQLYGLTMPSERPGHTMREQWHPLGTVGVLTAFNFPMAVWAWNSMLAFTCGDACVWKPSPKTPLTAIGLTNVIRPILEEEGFGALCGLAIGGNEDVAQAMMDDARLPMVSFTGSTAIGKLVAGRVAGRMGRLILECGGNNGLVVMDDADLEMVLPATLFGAVGTAGQRCTSTRRLLVHESLMEEVTERLVRAYDDVVIGDPMDEGTLCGPLIDEQAVQNMEAAVASCQAEGGTLLRGGGPRPDGGRARRRPLRGASAHDGPERLPDRPGRDLRADPLPDPDQGSGRCYRAPQRRAPGALQRDLHRGREGGRALPLRCRVRLRDRQREHRHFGG